MARQKNTQKGFTLVEMLVVAPIVILAIGAFLTAIIGMTGEVLASRASNNLSYNVQDALNHVEQDIKLSNSFLGTNNVIGTDQGYNNDATAFTNVGPNGTALILSLVATTSNPVSSSSTYVYVKNNPGDTCTSPQQNNRPFTYNVVYFVKDNTLFRRTLMPTNYNDTSIVCNVPWQQPSCSPDYMDNTDSDPTPPASFCKTKDIELVDGVASGDFLVQYYNGENTTSSNTSAVTATLASDRTSAMQGATTVGVTINAKQTAAGRDIARIATLRASRLDTNASSIGSITSDTSLATPKVSANVSEPTVVNVKWAKVPGATSYTFEYQIPAQSSTWNSSSTTGLTATVNNATHLNVVNVRVTATNGTITSSQGTASVTVPLWSPLAMQNGWIDYSPPFTSAAYTKTSAGLIVLKGMVKAGSGIIGYLPNGYRPAKQMMFTNSTNSAGGRVDIQADGAILMSVGSNAWFSLDGIAFMPSGTTFIAASFQNSWVNYSAATWTNGGYMLDGAGRVQVQGLIANGATASGTVMFNMPATYRPSEYLHILNDSVNSPTHFSIDSSGNVLEKGYGNAYYSVQATFYPTGRATGATCTTQWCALPMINGWKHYGAPYSVPQYTKSSDGLVMFKGLLNGGSSATAVVTSNLPAAYCPAETQLLAMSSNAVWARLDVVRNADGTCYLLPGAGATTTWISLDNIHYMADS